MIETLRTGSAPGWSMPEQRVPGLVVRGAPPLRFGNDDVPGRAQLNFLERVRQVPLPDRILLAAGGKERRLVHEIREVGPGHSWSRAGELFEVHVGRKRHVARVHLQDLHAALLVRRVDHDLPVESAGPQQRRIEHVGPIGGRQHDHPFVAGESVHLGQDLIERLLALVVAADRPRAAARPADRVDLVDEDDRRRHFPRFGKEFADAAGADADDHLDELGGAGAEERHFRLAGGGACEQGLSGPWRSGEQDTFRSPRTQPAIFLRVLQEVDDLIDLGLHLVDPGDIIKRDPDGLRIDTLLFPAAEDAAHRPLLASKHPHVERHEQQHRCEGDQEVREERRAAPRAASRAPSRRRRSTR